jgi:iron complex outermembrane receptor protein
MCGVILASGAARAADAADAAEEPSLRKLGQLSLEELMRVPVTSVAGTRPTRFSTPAAITVITAQDIRRSGLRDNAEVLRLVPGMFVGRVNSGSWVVGARGLTGSSFRDSRYVVVVEGGLVLYRVFWVSLW